MGLVLRRGFGAVEPDGPIDWSKAGPGSGAIEPAKVPEYQVTAASAETVRVRSARASKSYGIAGAAFVAGGGLLAVASKDCRVRAVGVGAIGAGVLSAILAIRERATASKAEAIRDAYARALTAAGHPVPGVPSFNMEKGG